MISYNFKISNFLFRFPDDIASIENGITFTSNVDNTESVFKFTIVNQTGQIMTNKHIKMITEYSHYYYVSNGWYTTISGHFLLNKHYIKGNSISKPHTLTCIDNYSRLSLSRTPRDSLEYIEIPVLRHIRCPDLRKNLTTKCPIVICNLTPLHKIYYIYLICLALHAILRELSLWKVLSIKSTSLSLIRLWSKVVYNVEKVYVDKLDARKPRDFSLFNTSH